MSNVKTILTVIAIVLGAVLALAAIGMIVTALQYLFWLGMLCLAAVVAVKLLRKPDSQPLEGKGHQKELKNVGRTLEEYKRKYLAK